MKVINKSINFINIFIDYLQLLFWHDEWENINVIDGTLDYKCRKLVEKTERIRNKKFDKWIQSKFVPVFDENGNIIKKIGIISDITKTKELEERLESLRIDFFANLSHEIRTPITLILSCIQILNIKIANMEEKDIKCEDDIKISVKDNGIGIPKDKQNRVFERFGQVKNKMKTESEGSGIGLFLVKHLVELNGGKIDLNSELGKGSEFIITLPNKTVKQEEGELILNKVENKIDRMNIEFSDIYIQKFFSQKRNGIVQDAMPFLVVNIRLCFRLMLKMI